MNILNIGCGTDTKGTHFIDKNPLRPEVKRCDIDEFALPYNNDIFDVVIMNNIFEHLRNPGFVLKEVYRVLKLGGRLDIITDNAGYFFYHAGQGHTHYGGYEKNNPGDYHFSLFTSNHIKNHLNRAGFNDVEWDYYDDFNSISFGHKMLNSLFNKLGFVALAYPKLKFKAWKR